MSNLLTDPENLEAWRQNRMTQAFLQFLGDRLSDLTQQWAQGMALGPEEQAQAVTLNKLIRLSSDDLRQYYGVEDEDGKSEA